MNYLVISIGDTVKYVQIVNIQRETSTHNFVYCLYKSNESSSIYISQSIPVLVSAINASVITQRSETLFCSSLYRMLRLRSRRREHKKFRIEKFNLDAIADLNNLIKGFETAVFITKNPSNWKATLTNRNSEPNENGPVQ